MAYYHLANAMMIILKHIVHVKRLQWGQFIGNMSHVGIF